MHNQNQISKDMIISHDKAWISKFCVDVSSKMMYYNTDV